MERVELWQPDIRIPKQLLDLDGWKWDEHGLRVSLTDDRYRYSAIFEGQVIAFRSTLEHVYLRFRDRYGEWRKKLNLNCAYSFFVLYETEYIQWLNNQHYDIYNDIQDSVRHFVFVTEDEIIEVLDNKEPKFLIEEIRISR